MTLATEEIILVRRENGGPSLDPRNSQKGSFSQTTTDSENGEPTKLNEQSQKENPNISNRKQISLWRVETRRIFLICSLAVLPMVAFTATTLWLVFHYRLGAAVCPYPQLCPQDSKLNMSRTDFTTHYYVDYPAARLVFIASLSSSLSFTLVAALMATYSYVVACRFLRLSEKDAKNCPTPYDTSVLLRILNAEILALFEILACKIKEIFWEGESHGEERKSTKLLRASIIVFIVGICTSIFIQATDTNLHIATEAVELVRIQPLSTESLAYSRGLAPWCLSRPTYGSTQNRDFWGCGVHPDSTVLGGVESLNYTQVQALNFGSSKFDSVMDFVDENGEYTAIVGPKDIDQAIDWRAFSFGVSTQCRALRNDSCDLTGPTSRGINDAAVSFNCTKERAGLDISGNIYGLAYQTYFLDWHRFVQEPPPFDSSDYSYNDIDSHEFLALAANLSEEDGRDVFSNPWSLLSSLQVIEDAYDFITKNDTENMIWELETFAASMLHCNVTVWDVEYTSSLSQITSVNRTPSNSSTAGTASMPMAFMWRQLVNLLNNAGDEANIAATTAQEFVHAYEKAVSRKFLSAMAGQCSPRSALAAQSRSSRIVSKVPKTAVWLLIAANLFFVLFAIVLTVFALVYSSADTHQVYIRLSIAGLVAQLFEGNYAHQKVKDSYDLFREHAKGEEKVVQKVTVERLAAEGTAMKLV